MKHQTGCNIHLVTVDNIHEYIMEGQPLHPVYEFLSETHKCDILRTYFIYHYGGSYSDIKIPNGSWVKGFEYMESDPEKWIS